MTLKQIKQAGYLLIGSKANYFIIESSTSSVLYRGELRVENRVIYYTPTLLKESPLYQENWIALRGITHLKELVQQYFANEKYSDMHNTHSSEEFRKHCCILDACSILGKVTVEHEFAAMKKVTINNSIVFYVNIKEDTMIAVLKDSISTTTQIRDYYNREKLLQDVSNTISLPISYAHMGALQTLVNLPAPRGYRIDGGFLATDTKVKDILLEVRKGIDTYLEYLSQKESE